MMLAIFSSKMFETEENLVVSSIPHCETLTSASSKGTRENTVVLREVNVGFGIADIVVVEHTPCSYQQQVLLKHDISIYKVIEKQGKYSVPDIIESTRLNKQQVNISLNKLGDLGYITWSCPKTVELVKKYESTIRDVVAIEAKLKDWKRALNQAYRYKWFASRSYVLLDNAHLKPAIKNLNAFQTLGVGLMSLDLAGNWKTIYEPKADEPINHKMTMLLNEQVKAYHFVQLRASLEKFSTHLNGSCCSPLSSELHDALGHHSPCLRD